MDFGPNTNAHYQEFLTKIFGQMDEAQVAQIFANTQILELEAGKYLFEQLDLQNALYIVLSGRLRVLTKNENGTQILGDVSAGEPVGELALFTKEPRSASVVALRKSLVLQLSEADYLVLVQQNPQFAHILTNFVINRLRRNAFQQRMGSAPKNIAVVNLDADFDLSPWTEEVRRQLDAMSVGINVYYPEDWTKGDSTALFDEMDNNEGLNFLVCDDQHQEWADQCIIYCDLILVAADFYAQPDIRPIEEHLRLYYTNILNKKNYLLLLHPDKAPMPVNTRRWFDGRNLALHLHIRKHHTKDIRRFCRIITHQAVGLVLGGGGAKGCSHIGTAKALMEAGIEFDFVGGTSAGALFGITLTVHDFDIPKIMQIAKNGAEAKPTSNDYHFPFISMMTGRKMRKVLEQNFGSTHLEDIWVTSYTVSTNYSTASLRVHDMGLTRQQVEASLAIPGVFPPVIIDQHLHVDGGVMDNLPIEAMYQMPVRHVIAVALSAQSPHLVEIEEVPSAMTMFINKFTKKHRFRLPQMSSLLINSLTLNSVQKQKVTKSQVALYLEMDLQKFGFLDWSKWKQLMDKGYEQTQKILAAMPENEKFWFKK